MGLQPPFLLIVTSQQDSAKDLPRFNRQWSKMGGGKAFLIAISEMFEFEDLSSP
jgi:hypothetical protein